MNVLQICSYFIGSKLYRNFFKSIEGLGIVEDIYVFTDKKSKLIGDNAVNLHISRCFNKFDRLIFHLKHYKVLNDIENEMEISNYEVTHAHSLFSNGYIAYKLHKKYNVPYIVAVRNTDVNLFFKRMFHLVSLGIHILNNAEAIIFISPVYKKHVIDKYIPARVKSKISDKSFVIPNGIDAFWLNNKFVRNTGPESKKLTIIYVGSIDKNKNIETAIRACDLLIDQGYDIKYKVIGKIASSQYSDLISKNSFIEYIPFCEKEELIGHYRNSDIFLMPSIHETFGLVYAEAMSQGLPVIYSKGQGFDGQFEEGEVGFHVESFDAESIVSKVCEIEDNYLDISRRCVLGCEKFNWDTIAAEYADIYKKIVEKEKNI